MCRRGIDRFDVTSGMLTGEGRVPIAPRRVIVRRLRSPAARLCQCRIRLRMSVKRIREAPRITRPFPDRSSARLDRLGEEVDADLKSDDVRLTMGGDRPSFPRRSANRQLSSPPSARPSARSATNSFANSVTVSRPRATALRTGKWSPGESLSALGVRLLRARTACRSRRCRSDRSNGIPRKAGIAVPAFYRKHRYELGLGAEYVVPAFEDPAFWLTEGDRAAAQCRPRRFQILHPESGCGWRGSSITG